jgi:hypothetical protein
MKRKWMETAVIWLLVMGPLLIGVGAAIYWGSGNNTIGLWGGFVPGVVALVFAAAFQVQIINLKATEPEKPASLSPEAAAQRIVIAAQATIQRAWLSVTPQIAGQIEKDKSINLSLITENVGHEPATGVSHHGVTMMFDMPDQIGYAPELWSPDFQQVIKLECDLAYPVKGRATIFPGNKPVIPGHWDSKPEVADLVDGRKILVTYGCVGYFTKGDEPHYTWYCFFLKRDQGQWQIGSAPIGNDAN